MNTPSPDYADPMIPQLYTVVDTIDETHDSYSIVLENTTTGKGMSFTPGQFNMLYQFGIGEVPISISGHPEHDEQLIHTIRAIGPVTRAIKTLTPGETLGVRGPFGSSWPVDAAIGKHLLLIAGGIGLAPLRPVIYEALHRHADFEKITLLIGARHPVDVLYIEHLRHWRDDSELDLSLTVDSASADWKNDIGVVTNLIPGLQLDQGNTLAMVCGPEVMMHFTILALQKKGLGIDSIYVSTERNMKCAIGFCGHCQYGNKFVCKDGPIFRFDQIEDIFYIREL